MALIDVRILNLTNFERLPLFWPLFLEIGVPFAAFVPAVAPSFLFGMMSCGSSFAVLDDMDCSVVH